MICYAVLYYAMLCYARLTASDADGGAAHVVMVQVLAGAHAGARQQQRKHCAPNVPNHCIGLPAAES
jgi:hypothetical protein